MSEEYIIIHSFLTLGLFTIIIQLSGLLFLVGLYSRFLNYLIKDDND